MTQQNETQAPSATRESTDATPESGTLRERVQAVIENMINPAVGMHGGFVNLVDVKDNVVFVEMGGGCQGCAASQMTLRSGIEAMIREEVPEVTEVRDATNHGEGSNPYYR